MPNLNKSQQKILDYIKQTAPSGVPPTVREICAATGLSSTSTVHSHLKTLERLGYISRDRGLNRSIRVEGMVPSSQVPILGRVTAGVPILAVEDITSPSPTTTGGSCSPCTWWASVCGTRAFWTVTLSWPKRPRPRMTGTLWWP